MKTVTEGIIKAEGLTWFQVVVALMKVIMPWKGRLTATFVFGVLRVLSFIGVGASSALTEAASSLGDQSADEFAAFETLIRAIGPATVPGLMQAYQREEGGTATDRATILIGKLGPPAIPAIAAAIV